VSEERWTQIATAFAVVCVVSERYSTVAIIGCGVCCAVALVLRFRQEQP
jgi:hypothetical protein